MKKIFLIGDSIRMGYDKYVKMAFDGVAEVYYPDENCRFTTYIVRNLFDWTVRLGLDESVDLLHWNVGLWDVLHMIDGEVLVSPEDYRHNMKRICEQIKHFFPNAKLIFATSTPVQEKLFNELKRYNREIEQYNEIAREVLKDYGTEINDLYALMQDVPTSFYSDMTHFYTKEGTERITNQVVEKIAHALDIRANPLDYEALFSRPESVLGH